ncbi:hypothetical protein KNP414_02082 [Paenibacillus mucilaginosus KNP414]|uniref:Uncharacterized protein n=1 Tax=Paenibacillus mucilaginosus (strain KNP414) TaxID=1036673 RepID=F8FRT6_PAEMK|nr:hypothetical protein KNP414_02082 [Paenibacillus mucilaginosus KNP414]
MVSLALVTFIIESAGAGLNEGNPRILLKNKKTPGSGVWNGDGFQPLLKSCFLAERSRCERRPVKFRAHHSSPSLIYSLRGSTEPKAK